MKLIAATVFSLSLLAPGCGKVNRGNTPSREGPTPNTPVPDPMVRVAELEIDPGQLENYKAAVKEEIETSVREEPGVLAIYAVAEKDNPSKLRFFEMYGDEAAYKSHLSSKHFREYVRITKDMIISRRLIDTVPLQLSAKNN